VSAVGDTTAAVAFADIQRSLSLFAEGIAGQFVQVTTAVVDGATGVRRPGVTPQPAVTTVVVTVPNEFSLFGSGEHNRGAYRVAVLHQIGYLENGTYTLDIDGFARDASNPELYRRVFVTLEDLRVDTNLRHDYPGIRADLDRVTAHALAARPTLRPDTASGLLEALVRYSLGSDPADLIQHDETDLLAELLDLASVVAGRGATVEDSAKAAVAICAMFDLLGASRLTGSETAENLQAPAEEAPSGETAERLVGGRPDNPDFDALELTDDDLTGASVDFRGDLEHENGRHTGRASGSAADTATDPKTARKPAGALEPTPDLPDDAGPSSSEPPPSRRAAPNPQTTESTRTYLYDEWNYHTQTYERAWCRLHEHRLTGTDHAFITDVRRRHSLLAGRVKRHFSSIRPEAWHRVHRAPDGDELGIDSVIQAVIDRRSGFATDEQLYIRRDRAVRDVAAAFLLDMSRSTDSPVVDPDEPPPEPRPDPSERDLCARGGYFDFDDLDLAPTVPKRRVIDVAKESLALMCDALQTLGDSHAMYGFSGSTRHNVEFHVAKEFNDPTSPRTWAALAAMEPIRYTRMGPPIRHCVAKLSAQPERTKVLVVVTDGYPQDEDYGPNRNDRDYGIHDTARALEEAENAGISTFCVTVDPAGHDYLRRMCAPDRYLVIDDVIALPGELEKVYRILTGR
jgi:nitric oxide reductase NorD protein